jgi:GWT1
MLKFNIGGNMLITCLAILAVDFRIFPRRFAKTETFGISLMDIGVGTFIVSSAVTSRYARGQYPPRVRKSAEIGENDYNSEIKLFGDHDNEINDKNNPRNSSINEKNTKNKNLSVINEIKRILLLFIYYQLQNWKHFLVLFLGVGRMILLKLLDYQENISEYGVHWNFFVTLFSIWQISDFFHRIVSRRFLPSFAILVLLLYQFALSKTSLTDFIFAASRKNFFYANREGFLSLFGYVPMYLLVESFAHHFFYNLNLKVERDCENYTDLGLEIPDDQNNNEENDDELYSDNENENNENNNKNENIEYYTENIGNENIRAIINSSKSINNDLKKMNQNNNSKTTRYETNKNSKNVFFSGINNVIGNSVDEENEENLIQNDQYNNSSENESETENGNLNSNEIENNGFRMSNVHNQKMKKNDNLKLQIPSFSDAENEKYKKSKSFFHFFRPEKDSVNSVENSTFSSAFTTSFSSSFFSCPSTPISSSNNSTDNTNKYEKNKLKDKIGCKTQRKFFRQLFIISTVLWVAWLASSSVQQTSRRLANLAYVSLVLALSFTLIFFIAVADSMGDLVLAYKGSELNKNSDFNNNNNKHNSDNNNGHNNNDNNDKSGNNNDNNNNNDNTDNDVSNNNHTCNTGNKIESNKNNRKYIEQKYPVVPLPIQTLENINLMQLPVFLIANVFTGVVNMTIKTIYSTHIFAFSVLCVYSVAFISAAWLLSKKIKEKN